MAHIPDGFLSLPVTAGTAVASATALAVATRRTRATLGEREGPVLGAATAFIFAAQMLNFPLGIGASAHLLGGTLVAVLVGPWAGMLVLFAVLLVQALLFQDGGIAALGANTLNLSVLGVGSAWLLFRWARALLGDGRVGAMVAAGAAALGSTALVGVAVAAELAWSGLVPLRTALLVVGGGHLLVGVAEAAITAMLLGFVLRARPDLVRGVAAPPPGRARALAGLAVAVTALAVLAASPQPDVLEAAFTRFGFGEPMAAAGATTAPMVAALVGLLAAFVVSWGFAMAIARRRP